MVGHNEYDLMRTELANFRGHPPQFEDIFLRAYQRHVPLDGGYVARKDFYDVSRTLVWMKTLVKREDMHAERREAQFHEAARAHLHSLLSR